MFCSHVHVGLGTDKLVCVVYIVISYFRCEMSEEDSEMDTENIVEDFAAEIGVNLD